MDAGRWNAVLLKTLFQGRQECRPFHSISPLESAAQKQQSPGDDD